MEDIPVAVLIQNRPFIRAILKNVFKVLTTVVVTKSFILDETESLDLPVTIKKIDLSLCYSLCCLKVNVAWVCPYKFSVV